MTIQDITADPTVMREPNKDLLTVAKFTDAQLTALMRDAALAQLDIDLKLMTGVSDEEDDYSDLIVKYEEFLKLTIANLQLKLYYHQQIDASSSLTQWRYEKYEADYHTNKSDMKRLTLDVTKTIEMKSTAWNMYR